jgi:UDP-GlcNAc:undecaprenyl-phosphate GlcNAc-1-phosphate transferase
MVVTFIWLVGIANAINLLDNMDGLAGGISLIAAGFLSYFFWRSGNEILLTLSLAIAGSVLGFLVFNFPPAKIFMGDSGSMFLGFTLAAVAVAREPQASSVFAVLGVPLMLLLLPILDTTMVTFTRILRGQSPSRGGKDHTSHRLVALGLTERQAVLILYGVAVVSGISAIALEAFSYSLSLILIPVLVISLSLFTAYLARTKVVPVVDADSRKTVILRLLTELTYKRRLLEVLMDFFFIGLTYYLAFVARFGLPLVPYNMRLYLQSLPLIIVSAYLAFFALGIYRGVWRYIGLEDMVQYAKAVGLSAVLAAGGLVILYRFEGYSRAVFMLYPLFLFLALAVSRVSFRLLDQMAGRRRQLQTKVLIYGAGDAGEMALRECRQNPKLGYELVGFLDDDPLKKGRRVHGVEVLGSLEQLDEILESSNASGLIVASQDIWDSGRGDQALTICNSKDVWVRRLKLEFELEEYS